jgi:tol-pal system protein YbgF
MVRTLKPANMSPRMIRPVLFLLIALACTFGAHIAKAQDADSDLDARVDRLEGTIRNLTGQVEQLQYHNQQLEQQVQRLQQQMQGGTPAASPPPAPPQYSSPSYSQPSYSQPSYSAPSYQPPAAQYSPPPAAPASAGGVPTDSSHDAFNPRIDPNAPGVPRPLGTSTNATEPPPVYTPAPRQAGAPLDLSSPSAPQGAVAGQLPAPPPANPSATGGMQASLTQTMPPANTPKDEYELGQGYLQRKDYVQAAQTFRAFLHQYPGDRLTPDVQYYLGESLFQSQQYHDAAEAFLTVSTKYETTARAPDALLRLGESLSALGQKEAACASLGEVLRKYPHASLSVKESVSREQKRVHC